MSGLLDLLGPMANMTEDDARGLLGPISGISPEQGAELLRGPQQQAAPPPEDPSGLTPEERAELEELRAIDARERDQSPQEDRNPLIPVGVAAIQGARKVADNILGLPEDAGRALAWLAAAPPAAIQAGLAGIQGKPGEFWDRHADHAAAQREQFPARQLIGAGQLDSGQLAADMRSLPGFTGRAEALWDMDERMQHERSRQQEADAAMREQNPIATTVGEIGGDIATVLTARSSVQDRLRALAHPSAPKVTAPPGIKREFERLRTSKLFQNTERGVRRAAETGLEGAAVAMLNDGDPATTAALAAGAQSGGSLALYFAKEGLVKRFVPTVLATTLAVQLFKQAAPGIQQNVFESLDAANTKLIAAAGVGVLSAIAGLARLPKQTQQNLGAFGDALTPALRVPLLRMLSSFTEEQEKGDDTTLRVVRGISSNPQQFTPTQLNRIERAMRSGRGSLSEEIHSMAEQSPSFREVLDNL